MHGDNQPLEQREPPPLVPRNALFLNPHSPWCRKSNAVNKK